MAVTVTPQDKNTAVTIMNETKSGGATVTWNEATDTWQESEGTWANPNTPMASESKSTLVTVDPETKN